jgi:2-iminobutanoate/2-iminopropanoate deaminase
MADFAVVNEKMQQFFAQPYPARSTVAVAALPKGAVFEIEAVFCR